MHRLVMPTRAECVCRRRVLSMALEAVHRFTTFGAIPSVLRRYGALASLCPRGGEDYGPEIRVEEVWSTGLGSEI